MPKYTNISDLDALISQNAQKGSDRFAQAFNQSRQMKNQQAMQDSAQTAQMDRQVQEQEAKKDLEDFLLGRQNDIKSQQRQQSISQAQNLRQLLGKDAKVSVGDVSLDPRANGGLMRLTPAQESAEKAVGKQYADYMSGGGKASIDKNLGLLESVKKELADPKSDRGFVDRTLGAIPLIQDYAAPDEVSRQDRVRTAIQATLRQVMGAQFTEKEGAALMNRAYNPRLSAEENVRRIEAAAQELKQKQSLMEQAGQRYQQTGYATLGADTSPPPPADDPGRKRLEELRRKAAGR